MLGMAGFGKGANGAERESRMERYEIELVGLTPLLMHWDSIEGQDMIQEWLAEPDNKKRSKAGDDRTPPWTWKTYVYHDGKHVVLPSDNIRKCMLKAGAKVPTGKRQGTFKSEAVAGVVISDFHLPFFVNGKQIAWPSIDAIDGEFKEHVAAAQKLGFDLFVKRAAVNQTKHVRVRPMFRNWSCRFGVTVVDDQITETVLRRILDVAGRYMGLGDWRPGAKTPGPWGQFEAKIAKA